MTDADIVTLYWARDEQAIAQTAQKFGAYCRKIAMNLLGSQEDAEECENDTWMAAWWRSELTLTVIGLTGSNGKTSTKI